MTRNCRIVDRSWFERHPVHVAYDLIGTVIRVVRDGVEVSGRIVETEAYAGPLDLASHASRRQSARELLSGTPGTLYMYRSYGIHTMLNIVGHEPGQTGAILIRALDPLRGLDSMEQRRGGAGKPLTRGPGVLTQALGLRLSDLHLDLITSDEVALYESSGQAPVYASTRIGITRGLSTEWRFFDPASPHVSVHRRGVEIDPDELDALIPPSGSIIE